MPADLNEGFETFQKLDDSGDEHLDALLDTVVALEENTGSKCEADIITWRGMMTKVRAVVSFFLFLLYEF
jgi:RAT1-interacting protein